MATKQELEPTGNRPFSRGSVTVAGALKDYGLGRTTLYQLMLNGLPYTKVGTRRIIPRAAIEEWLERGLVGDK